MLSSPPKALLTLLKRQGDSAGGGGARATTPRFAGLLLGRNPEGRAPCPKGSQLCSWTKLGDRQATTSAGTPIPTLLLLLCECREVGTLLLMGKALSHHRHGNTLQGSLFYQF